MFTQTNFSEQVCSIHPKSKILSSFTHPNIIQTCMSFFCGTQKKIFFFCPYNIKSVATNVVCQWYFIVVSRSFFMDVFQSVSHVQKCVLTE